MVLLTLTVLLLALFVHLCTRSVLFFLRELAASSYRPFSICDQYDVDEQFVCSAIGVTLARLVSKVASSISFAVQVPATIANFCSVAASERIGEGSSLICCAADSDDDDDNNDDDDQQWDANAKRTADTAGAESSLSGLGCFIT